MFKYEVSNDTEYFEYNVEPNLVMYFCIEKNKLDMIPRQLLNELTTTDNFITLAKDYNLGKYFHNTKGPAYGVYGRLEYNEHWIKGKKQGTHEEKHTLLRLDKKGMYVEKN